VSARRKRETTAPAGSPAGKRQRLDQALHERGLAASREAGRRLVMAGEILVDGQTALKPSQLVNAEAVIEVKTPPRFVSRGGEKLAAALDEFAVLPAGWVCADVGASTGGFTDCLLQAGASRVYAIDVGYGQLAWSLRNDSRVKVMERVNARYLHELPEQIELVCMDASFISLKLLIPAARGWLAPDGQMVALVKPQFEAGREQVGKGGVVRSEETHAAVLRDIMSFATNEGLSIRGLMPSPITGPAGNVEFLLWLSTSRGAPRPDVEALILAAIERAPSGLGR